MISNKQTGTEWSLFSISKSSYFYQICIKAAVADKAVRPEGILKGLNFAVYTETRRFNQLLINLVFNPELYVFKIRSH